MVARRNRGHALAHVLDAAGSLVPEHGRERVRGTASDHVPVAVAHAARREADRHLTAARGSELDVLDAPGPVDLAEDWGAHER